MLEDEAGSNIVDHQAKADLIWIAFKERLGVSSFTDINLDLGLFFQTHVESAVLTEPFSTDEIDTVVKSLPSDKALAHMDLIQTLLRNVGQLLNRIFFFNVTGGITPT